MTYTFPPHEELAYLASENRRLRRELDSTKRMVTGLKDRLARAGISDLGFVDDLPSVPQYTAMAVGREEFYVYKVVVGEHITTEDRIHIAQSLGHRFAQDFANKTIAELGTRVPLDAVMFDDAYYEQLNGD